MANKNGGAGAMLATLAKALPALASGDGSAMRELLRLAPLELRTGLRLAAELIAAADFVGPPDPPRFLSPLFRDVADSRKYPAELLGAVAHTLTRCNVAHDAGGRIGLMGLPRGMLFGARAVTLDQLVTEAGAIASVRENVEAAADALIAAGGADPGRLGGALLEYCTPGYSPAESAELAGRILTAALLSTARRMDPDMRGKIPGWLT